MFSSIIGRSIAGRIPIRSFSSLSQTSALSLIRQNTLTSTSIFQSQQNITKSPINTILNSFQQLRFASRGNRRGGNRGNTYQPSTLKRKRRLGFLARMKTIDGRKIVKRRELKGRWYLTH